MWGWLCGLLLFESVCTSRVNAIHTVLVNCTIQLHIQAPLLKFQIDDVCGNDKRYTKFLTVPEAAGKGGGLDKVALQVEIEALGLTHKYKHILGVEELQ